MLPPFNIVQRTPIWIALSDFYLDTELQEYNFEHIATVIAGSPYTLEEVKEINQYEVFPVLQMNLMSVAGEWAGFNEKWLVNQIIDSLNKRSTWRKWLNRIWYAKAKWMCADYWKKLELHMQTQE